MCTALVRVTDGSEAQLDEYLKALDEEYDIVGYKKQTTSKLEIDLLEHEKIAYSTKLDSNCTYYVIYIYHSDNDAAFFDIRGH